ncbi:TetR/AcrR family transcriptional regulator [Roseobacter ponti]|uniref:TetR/AcrR family transcriptional regulator n=1 Tax=Roseobacter ponti TaxID=1891787 RepID=A0A858STA9_9RHOB|nr:TetR/AcrR family transcriptional regulator [Roseobacter ponti]QJF51560.1 TetR/AcrR family transcriptional regulator [Roseobacter ponti]
MARTAGSHSDVTGPRVRAAALRLFAKSGYAAVSMRSIAAEVGVQVGALYNYTPDKQSLLFDLMRSHLEDLLERAGPGEGEAAERLAGFVSFHIRYHHDRQDAVFIAYMELRNLSEENFQVIEGLRRRYEDLLEEILAAGVAEGRFDIADTRIATRAVIAMLTGVSTWFRESGRLTLEDVETQYRKMVLNAVRV